MIVYRLSAQAYCTDLSGYGAEKSGGRWNSKGIPVLYTAASRALAVVEIAVHMPLGLIPVSYFLTVIELPDDVTMIAVPITELPVNWNRNPFIKATQSIGDKFIKDNNALILQVPSASVQGDYNYLVNPHHHDFENVHIKSSTAFEFDLRLFKK